jgi:hypothetical protein
MMQLSHAAKHWRDLAEEARMGAAAITNQRSKQFIVKVAEAYDRVAQRLEKEEPLGHERSG